MSAAGRALSWWRSSWCGGLRSQSASSFIFALVCVAAATLVRLALGLLSPDSTVFAPYYAATLVAALVGGASAGALAAGTGGIVALFLFIPPEWGLASFRLAADCQRAPHSPRRRSSSSGPLRAIAACCSACARKRRAESLLNHELNHRIKNLLASVQAILYQTLAITMKSATDDCSGHVACGDQCRPR